MRFRAVVTKTTANPKPARKGRKRLQNDRLFIYRHPVREGMSYDIGTQLENENPQTAARLSALVAVVWTLSFGFIQSVVKATGVPALTRYDDRRKTARSADAIRESLAHLWDIMEMNTAPHSMGFLPASLVGHEKVKPIGSRLQNAEIDVALRTYALNPKGVGYSVNVLQSGKVKHLVKWAAVWPKWIRAVFAAGGHNPRSKRTADEAKKNSKGGVHDGLRFYCNRCNSWKDNDGDVTSDYGPVCCDDVTVRAIREGEQSDKYEAKVRIPCIHQKHWNMNSVTLKGNSNDSGDIIAADPFDNVRSFPNYNVGRLVRNLKLGSGRFTHRIMATLMVQNEGYVDESRWLVWVAVPCSKIGLDIKHPKARKLSGLSINECNTMLRIHNQLKNRDAIINAEWSTISGSKPADRKAIKAML